MHGLSCGRVPEIHANVSFVRLFVFREADIAIYTKQRSTVRLGISDQPGADRAQPELQVSDEAQARLASEFFEFRFVFQEPGTPIVATQLFQKLKELGIEIRRPHGTDVSDLLGWRRDDRRRSCGSGSQRAVVDEIF